MQFGLYLRAKGVISAEQLVDALELQHRKLVPIGQLAMEEGILSARDVFRVLRCQSDLVHEPFGEVAVGMGLMTHVELQRLLMLQLDRKPSLRDTLVRLGILTPAQIDAELANFRREMERRNVVVTRRIASPLHMPAVPKIPSAAEADCYAMMI